MGGFEPALQLDHAQDTHEAVGTIEQVGAAVTTLKPGDRVLVSCISACGRCRYCRAAQYGQCLGGGGWILGHRINGTQAEKVRVPFAETSTYRVPEGVTDEQVLMLADILPTGYEVGVLNARVQPGDVVAVVGAGPIGLAAMMTAKLFSPSAVVAIDLADSRLEAAMCFGATAVVNNSRENAFEEVMRMTAGLGADVAIEAVGVPDTFELCARLIRPGGRVANVGVHGKPVALHLEELWIRNVAITTGLVDTYSTPTLLRLVSSQNARCSPLRHAPFQARPVHGSLRRVRTRWRDRGTQACPHAKLDRAPPHRRLFELQPVPAIVAVAGFVPEPE